MADRRAISVVIPCHDGAGTIVRAIDSVLSQDVEAQVVVVDDGSTDSSAEVVSALDEPAVKLVRQCNAGVCAARNAGAAAADGEFLVFLDVDDELMPGALGRYLDALDPRLSPVARAALILQRDAEATVVLASPTDHDRPHPRGSKIPGSFAVWAPLFSEVGGYAEGLRFGENTELLLRLALVERDAPWSAAMVEQPAVLVHRRAEGRTARYGDEPARAAEFVLERHGSHLGSDPQIVHDYRAIIGVERLRSGNRKAARREFARSLRARPRSWRAWARLARTFLPSISRRDGQRVPLIAVVSPGAGRIRRGYEAFAVDFAAQLLDRGDLDVVLLQGGPASHDHRRRVPHVGRHGRLARALAHVTGLYATSIEHYSFGLASLPTLLRRRPEVIVLAERVLANLYGELLPRLGLNARIVLRNGGSHRPPFRHVDVVIHHTPDFLAAALEEPGAARHVHLPYAFDIPEQLADLGGPRRRALAREQLGLDPGRPVVISIGALDCSVKRMDHVVRELAALETPRPYLVLLGQRESETDEIESLAAASLEPGSWMMKTVASGDVASYLAAADVFVLASPKEGFGRVYVEALAAGLPCIVHDTEHTRWVLGGHGCFVDMTSVGPLTAALSEVLDDPHQSSTSARQARHSEMFERYSWRRLLPGYLDALGVGGGEAPPVAGTKPEAG